MRKYELKYYFSDGLRHLLEVKWLDVVEDADKSIKFSWFCNLSGGEIKPLNFHFMSGTTRVFHECRVVVADDKKSALLFIGTTQVGRLSAITSLPINVQIPGASNE